METVVSAQLPPESGSPLLVSSPLPLAGVKLPRTSTLRNRAPSCQYGRGRTRSELEAIAASWRAWGEDPDALWCFSHTEMVARRRLPPGDGGDAGVVWDASAGAVRAFLLAHHGRWRWALLLRRGVRQPAPHHHEAQQCRRLQGLDATFLHRRWYRVFAPEVDPSCLRPAQFERLGRAGSVPTTGSCRTGQR